MAYQPKSYKKFVATAATATLVASAVVPAAFADEVKTAAFTDVAPQYQAAVDFVLEQAIAKGVSETQFGISQEIIRGDAAIMVANAANLNDPDAASSGFTDVPTRGAVAINSLKAAGVTSGKSATQFDFYGDITRGEAAIFLANAFNLEGDTSNVEFTDVNSRYLAAVAALVDNGVTNGKTATQFGTDENITRGDFARWLFALETQIVGETSATDAVVKVEESLLEIDLEAAWLLVDALEASDEKILLSARLDAVQAAIDELVDAVNAADEQLEIYEALTAFPLENAVSSNIAAYQTALALEAEFTTLAEVQAFIDDVNADVAVTENAEVQAEAATVVTSPETFDLEDFYAEVAQAQAAINAVSADVLTEDEESLKEVLQANLDEAVEFVENYIEIVSPILNATTDIELYDLLKKDFNNVVAANVDEYVVAGSETVADIQLEIDFVNAEQAINAFTVTSTTTQADIDALTDLVEEIADQDVAGIAGLYVAIEALQADLDALIDAAAELAAALEAAEDAQAAFVAAGGDVDAAVYTDLEAAVEAEDTVAIENATLALNAETEALIEYDAAIEAAEAALVAYVAAGGDVNADVYTILEADIANEVELLVLLDSTDDLEDITEELVIVAAINNASTATELQAALAELELAGYDNLSLVQRVEVANRLLEVVATGNYDTYAEVTNELVVEISNAITNYENDLAAVNAADSIVAVDTLLEELDLAGYNELTAAEQLVVSESVLNNRPEAGYTSFSSIVAEY